MFYVGYKGQCNFGAEYLRSDFRKFGDGDFKSDFPFCPLHHISEVLSRCSFFPQNLFRAKNRLRVFFSQNHLLPFSERRRINFYYVFNLPKV